MAWSEADLELLCSQVDDYIRTQKEENVDLVNQLVILSETVKEVESYNGILKRRLYSSLNKSDSFSSQSLTKPSKIIKKEDKVVPHRLSSSKSQSTAVRPPLANPLTSQSIRVTLNAKGSQSERIQNVSSLLRPPIIGSTSSTNRIQIQHLKPGQQIRLNNPKTTQSTATTVSSSTILINSSANAPNVVSDKSVNSSRPIVFSPRSASTALKPSPFASTGSIRSTLAPRILGGSVIKLSTRGPTMLQTAANIPVIQTSTPTTRHSDNPNFLQSASSNQIITHKPVSALISQSSSSQPSNSSSNKTIVHPNFPTGAGCIVQHNSNATTVSDNSRAVTSATSSSNAVNQSSGKQAMSNAFKIFAKSIGATITGEYGGSINHAELTAELIRRWKKLTDEEKRKYI